MGADPEGSKAGVLLNAIGSRLANVLTKGTKVPEAPPTKGEVKTWISPEANKDGQFFLPILVEDYHLSEKEHQALLETAIFAERTGDNSSTGAATSSPAAAAPAAIVHDEAGLFDEEDDDA